MIQGTASGVGKTIMTMALCRIFTQDGYKVAPFKSQNMTTYTALTKDGEEIAISQLLQSQAAKAEPSADMNPLILKPSSTKKGTDVILNGKYYDTLNPFHFKEIKPKLIPEIMQGYQNLQQRYDIIVIEGAGSPVELNLTQNSDDIVNMGIAQRTQSPVLLVADIDRGGVFAAIYGTVKLLEETQRAYIKALIVNRFKGDIAHFTEGVTILEDITGIPVAGVVPYVKFNLPEEDALYVNNSQLDRDFSSQFDIIADNVRQSLDMALIYKIISHGV